MWWWEGVACASRTVCGTCAHVGGTQDSFLGLAVMQVHGGQVVLGWRPGSVFVLLGAQWGSVPTKLFTGATVEQLHGTHSHLSALSRGPCRGKRRLHFRKRRPHGKTLCFSMVFHGFPRFSRFFPRRTSRFWVCFGSLLHCGCSHVPLFCTAGMCCSPCQDFSALWGPCLAWGCRACWGPCVAWCHSQFRAVPCIAWGSLTHTSDQ